MLSRLPMSWKTCRRVFGAGDENRTRPLCLGSKGATTTLRPRCDTPNLSVVSPIISPQLVRNAAFPQVLPQPFAPTRYAHIG